MDKARRKELTEQFRQMKIYMGVYQVQNTVNQKVFLGTATNLKNKWLTVKGQLMDGKHANALLQKEFKEYGEEHFTYTILEEKDTTDITDRKWELKQMKKAWMEKLQPYHEKGYHNPDARTL